MKISDRITLETFKKYNPIPSKTDLFYCGIANNLMKIIRNEIPEYPASYCCDMTVSLAKYFEDVVSDLGTWRAFTETHQARYGRPLPFYDLSGIDEYYPDEIHLQDVRFLIWNVMQSFEDETFINPEDERIEKLAHKITDILFDKYNEAPVNNDLLSYLYDYKDIPEDEWVFRTRQIALWLCDTNFLTFSKDGNALLKKKSADAEIFFSASEVEYCADAYISVSGSHGPLNMTGFEWYAAMCRNADIYNSNELFNLANCIVFKKLSSFCVESHDEETITFRGVDDDCFTMNKSEFNTYPLSWDETIKKYKYIVGAFLRWNDEWMPWGLSRWEAHDDIFTMFKDVYIHDDIYRKFGLKEIQEKCGNQQLFYLKNFEELATFNTVTLGIGKDGLFPNIPSDFPNDVPVALWLNIATGEFSFIPGAQCFNDSNNPYYDPSESSSVALEIIKEGSCVINKPTMNYLVNQGLLKDAACESSYGKERGHKLVQENIKFLCDYFRSN